MTKERKLAIQMWKSIRRNIAKEKFNTITDVTDYKGRWCKRHKLDWDFNCWFCQYIDCKKRRCVLGTCNSESLYGIAVNPDVNTEQRLEACDKIIAALEGRWAVK